LDSGDSKLNIGQIPQKRYSFFDYKHRGCVRMRDQSATLTADLRAAMRNKLVFRLVARRMALIGWNQRLRVPTPTFGHLVSTFQDQVQPIFEENRGEATPAVCYGCHICRTEFFVSSLASREARTARRAITAKLSERSGCRSRRSLLPASFCSILFRPEAGGERSVSFGGPAVSLSFQNDPDWIVIAEWVRGVRTGISDGLRRRKV